MVKSKIPYISKGDGGIDFQSGSKDNSAFILYGYTLAICVVFLILILRLFQLTVVKGPYYRTLSENNRIREIIIEPERGVIEDRRGFVLAKNFPADINAAGLRLPSKRVYTNGPDFAHVIGYRQLADQADQQNDTCH